MFSPVKIKSQEETKSNNAFSVSLDSLVNSGSDTIIYNGDIGSSEPSTSKTKKKRTKKVGDMDMVPADNGPDNMLTSNQSYRSSYDDTTDMLKFSIGQIDTLSVELKTDLDYIRKSKTMKNKYNYIPEISSTMGSLLSTKLGAIREINKVITDSHNLELKRMKDLKLTEDSKDDDKQIMDMYNAFISTPINSGMSPLAPNMIDLTMGANNIVRADAGDEQGSGYEAYVNNMTPTQQAMRVERDPNIQTVVVFEPESGRRWFDVVDSRTGASVPNVPRPDQMFLEDTTIDMNAKLARNTNLDQTYPLVISGTVASKY